MITLFQLDVLRDILINCDEEWLLSSINLTQCENRGVVMHIDKVNCQDMHELFDNEK